jgi:CrcB protein
MSSTPEATSSPAGVTSTITSTSGEPANDHGDIANKIDHDADNQEDKYLVRVPSRTMYVDDNLTDDEESDLELQMPPQAPQAPQMSLQHRKTEIPTSIVVQIDSTPDSIEERPAQGHHHEYGHGHGRGKGETPQVQVQTQVAEPRETPTSRRVSSSSPSTPSVFTFDEKPRIRTRSQSPFLDNGNNNSNSDSDSIKNLQSTKSTESAISTKSSKSAFRRPSLPRQMNSPPIIPSTKSSASNYQSKKPPRNSPSSDASNSNSNSSPNNLLLNNPLTLTKATSTHSYMLKYSNTNSNRKQSPWKRFVTHGSAALTSMQQRRSPINKHTNDNNAGNGNNGDGNGNGNNIDRYSPRLVKTNDSNNNGNGNSNGCANGGLPQTISISMKHRQDRYSPSSFPISSFSSEDNQNQRLEKHDKTHYNSNNTPNPFKPNLNDSLDDSDSDDEILLSAAAAAAAKSLSISSSSEIIQGIDDLKLKVPTPHSVDDSIFRCDTPIMRNRVDKDDNNDNQDKSKEKDRGKPIIIEEDESLTSLRKVNGSQEKELQLQGIIKTKMSSGESNIKTKLSLDESTFSMFSFFTEMDCMSIIYLASFAIIGSTIRVFLSRIFGNDCEVQSAATASGTVAIDDFLSPLSVCVTASGETIQSGGALFIDLPANMVGSFFLGIMTPLNKNLPALPWLKNNHPLQTNGSMHTSIRTGFCGSLTTFSSWNTQMIIMMVGKGTVLGVQIVPALMGYLIGLMLAISSFRGGRQFANALYSYRHPKEEQDNLKNRISDIETNDNDQNSVSYSVSTAGADTTSSRPVVIFPRIFSFDRDDEDSACYCLVRAIDCIVHGKYSPIMFTTLILTLFLVGDFAMGSSFSRTMWVTSLMSPLGTIIRWQFSFLNGKWFQNSAKWKYLPVGTLICNILACIVSALCAALISRLDEDAVTARLLLNATKVGFAGNLSTVSTFVKEVVHLSEKKMRSSFSYSYAMWTIVTCCFMGLCFYGPISV